VIELNRKKIAFLAAFFLFTFVAISYSPTLSMGVHRQGPEDLDILVLVATGFGHPFFDFRTYFEAAGASVSVISAETTTSVASCYNPAPTWISAEFLLSTFDFETLSDYDCLFIPPGGHWQHLTQTDRVGDLLAAAHAEGVLIGSLCIGQRVILEARDIVYGVKVAFYQQTHFLFESAGATPVADALVASDCLIATGSTGGGVPYLGGTNILPINEFCHSFLKTALGRSFVQSCTVAPTTGDATTTFSIIVETQDPSTGLASVPSTNIASVVARVYAFNETTPAHNVTLSGTGFGTYTGSFTGIGLGEYSVAIEVMDNTFSLEVVRDAASLTGPVAATIPPELLILLIGGGAGAAVVVIVAVILIRKRK
jgi:putative intracellular protease/amidase